VGINIRQRIVDVASQGIKSGPVRACEYGAYVYVTVFAQFDALEVSCDQAGISSAVAGIAV